MTQRAIKYTNKWCNDIAQHDINAIFYAFHLCVHSSDTLVHYNELIMQGWLQLYIVECHCSLALCIIMYFACIPSVITHLACVPSRLYIIRCTLFYVLCKLLFHAHDSYYMNTSVQDHFCWAHGLSMTLCLTTMALNNNTTQSCFEIVKNPCSFKHNYVNSGYWTNHLCSSLDKYNLVPLTLCTIPT